MNSRSIFWAWAIKNIICVICWTTLAVVFNKWWIALFAILFMSNLRTDEHDCQEQNKDFK